ncbi:sigma factor-like helix-turn-helix DNA-binding protein [Streptomyces sp. LBL]|uniref:sigma factor-like helix-turn-helix DNA-binding protein n=1 Tax=Streptomyces sp. LBL TaxID=2940562 RepID=UPI002475706C|nr:sigma factor-like helix-turn-helix DNA-binding protein [Streptomyces sp. LBL]
MPPTPDVLPAPPLPVLPVLPVLPTGHDFAAYARKHWSGLVVTARLLTDDPGAAEELARRTLVRMCARWRRVPRNDVDFHVRRCLVRNHLRRRLRGRWAARRRAVVVLRVWEGLADAEIAQLLGCSVGAVRAHARHGLKEAGADPGQLREVFTRAARDTVPSEVPLADLQAGGRIRRRRRLAVASAACAALLIPVALFAGDRLGGGGAQDGTSGARPGDGGRQATSPIRVVSPGERVTAGTGVRMWLTAADGHWSVPVRSGPFPGDDSVRPLDEPGVSLRVDSVNGGFFMSGLFHGLSGDPGRVEVRTGDGGRTPAKVLVLAGSPGWGIWYASTPLPRKTVQALLSERGDDRIVTVYDASGRVAARLDRSWGQI